ncbi:MAG TPA: glycerol kinase GlpK [Candidatus Acidoferrales bacterium]|nr:glycerol kinase GlpK [Candidatus Acidoferrales bacterium]
MSRYVLALDQGTTSSRAILFDDRGVARGFAQQEFAQHFPHAGWVEHDPDEIWSTQLATARGAIADAGLSSSEVATIGITNQRETTIVWERDTGNAVHPAIVWQDRRTAERCAELEAAGYGERVTRATGLRLDPYFSATKIDWLLRNIPGLRARAQRGELAFGTVDAWLLWKLTGGKSHATDYTNASRTLLFDLEKLAWSDELLAIFDIPRALLPEALPSLATFGATDPQLFGTSIPITGIAGDQQAALAGQAGFAEGLAKNTYGTGSFVVLHTGECIVRSRHGLLATVALGMEPGRATYALEGSIFVTGAAVQWLRDGLAIIASAGEIENLAAQVDDSGGVVFVPAFTGLGAPYWNPHARGTIVGLTRGTTRAHIARAVLDAIVVQCAEVVTAMTHDAGTALGELRVDGGAAANDLLLQLQADMLGCDVVRPATLETTALGAAYVAGVQAGVWRDFDEVSRQWRVSKRFSPKIDTATRDERLAAWQRAIRAATTASTS